MLGQMGIRFTISIHRSQPNVCVFNHSQDALNKRASQMCVYLTMGSLGVGHD